MKIFTSRTRATMELAGKVGEIAVLAWYAPMDDIPPESAALVVELKTLVNRFQKHLREGEDFATVLQADFQAIFNLGRTYVLSVEPDRIVTYDTHFRL